MRTNGSVDTHRNSPTSYVATGLVAGVVGCLAGSFFVPSRQMTALREARELLMRAETDLKLGRKIVLAAAAGSPDRLTLLPNWHQSFKVPPAEEALRTRGTDFLNGVQRFSDEFARFRGEYGGFE